MATRTVANGSETTAADVERRKWHGFAIRAFATIVARKHGMAVPLGDLENLSDEALEVRLRIVQELAHLPPA